MPEDAKRLRREIRKLGNRRKNLTTQEHKLAGEIASTIQRAKGTISLTEMAHLLGVDRTGLYRTYGA